MLKFGKVYNFVCFSRQHRVLPNIIFVFEIAIMTSSWAITPYCGLALTLIKGLHRGLLKEYKSGKNVMLVFHLFSGIIRWYKCSLNEVRKATLTVKNGWSQPVKDSIVVSEGDICIHFFSDEQYGMSFTHPTFLLTFVKNIEALYSLVAFYNTDCLGYLLLF